MQTLARYLADTEASCANILKVILFLITLYTLNMASFVLFCLMWAIGECVIWLCGPSNMKYYMLCYFTDEDKSKKYE
jgi:hypothetical protein